MESKNPTVKPSQGLEADQRAKIIEWEDYQQELARLCSLTSALEEAQHKKSILHQKLNAFIQVETKSLSQSNELDQLCERLESRKLVMGSMSMDSKVVKETIRRKEEKLSAEIRSLLSAGTSLSVARKNLQDSIKSLSGDKGYDNKNLQKLLRLRQHYMVSQVSIVYPVEVVVGKALEQELESFSSSIRPGVPIGSKPVDQSTLTICGLHLSVVPFSTMSFFNDKKEAQQSSSAFGYVAHAVSLIASYLQVPLRYPFRLGGSRSYICDHAPSVEHLTSSSSTLDATNSSTSKPVEFPLFVEGQDTTRAAYAVFLLNKDLEQLLNFISVKSAGPRHILENLKELLRTIMSPEYIGEFQIGENIKPLNPKIVSSVVHYGKLRYSMSHKATGESLVYNQLYPFEGLENYTSGIIHHVRLTGLKPNTRYYYRCGDPSIRAMSDIHSFKTMPVSGPSSYPSRIALMGDLGLTYNSTSTIDHLRSNNPDLILLIGDLTYANLYLTNGTGSDCYSCSFSDTPIHETYQPRWDYWGRFLKSLVSEVPIMMGQGNHEIELQAENQTFISYMSRFAFPFKESGSTSPLYYSFDVGGIHFIMLGGYTAYNKSDEQYKWLEKDLARVNRVVTPWLVATWHPPWYSTYAAHYRESECMKVAMEDLLYNYGVDIVFNGHVHAYERSNRVYNYTLDPCGPVHITIGDGGNREKMAIKHADEPGNCPEPSTTPDHFIKGFCAYNFTSGPAAGKFCWDTQPEYSAYRESSFGHGILEVKNETYALWIWHRNRDMYTEAGDQIYIVRQPDKCPVPKQLWRRDKHNILTEFDV